MSMGDRKTYELIQKNERRLSDKSTDHVNRAQFLNFFIFGLFFF